MQSKPVLDSTIMIQKKREMNTHSKCSCVNGKIVDRRKKMIGGTLMPWGKSNNPPQYTWFGSYSKDEKIKLW